MRREIKTRLVHWQDRRNRKPLILKGARQVGKTYSLKEFGRESFSRMHYVNFEESDELLHVFEKNLDPERIIQELSFFLDSSINPEKDLLILDEIQACPRALTSLKYFYEKLPGFAICSAGSLLGLQLGESSFPVGKVEYLEMYPMSFAEFLEGAGEVRYSEFLRNLSLKDSIPEIVHSRLWEQLRHYFIVGGLPEIVQTYVDHKDDPFSAFRLARKRQADLIKDYLGDIAKHSGKQNAMHIERVWKNVPAQLAREQNASATKFKFKGIVPGLKSYSRLSGAIDWLVAAGLIIKVHIANSGELPFSAYTAENRFKLFCFDVGMLGAISQLPAKTIRDYDYGTYKGYFAENFIGQEFCCSGVDQLYSWKEKRAEVEFMREVNGDVLPVEVKSGWVTQAKSLKVFAQKYSPPYRTIMSARNLNIDLVNQVHHYPLYMAARFPLD